MVLEGGNPVPGEADANRKLDALWAAMKASGLPIVTSGASSSLALEQLACDHLMPGDAPDSYECSYWAAAAANPENVVIQGKIVEDASCAPLTNAVDGVDSATGKAIHACAADLQTASFTNGATPDALTDHKTYYIVGTLHEGILSVSEIARIGE
jgi:hypothetical protein